jgi:hypothetical protein
MELTHDELRRVAVSLAKLTELLGEELRPLPTEPYSRRASDQRIARVSI